MKASFLVILTGGFCVRVVVAIWNGFYGPSPGAELDAQGLHGFASAVANMGSFDDFRIGYTPYTNTLGWIYANSVDHIFWGSLISCFAWLGSAMLFADCLRIVGADRSKAVGALVLYAFLPSTIFLTSVTLREPFQLLFVNLACYGALQVLVTHRPAYLCVFVPSLGLAGALHPALLVFGVIFAGLVIGAILNPRAKKTSWVRNIGLFVTLLCFSWLLARLMLGSDYLAELTGYEVRDGLTDAAQRYQQSVAEVDARSNYRSGEASAGFFGAIFFVLSGAFQYLFEPLPWNVNSFADILALGENVARALLPALSNASIQCSKAEGDVSSSRKSDWDPACVPPVPRKLRRANLTPLEGSSGGAIEQDRCGRRPSGRLGAHARRTHPAVASVRAQCR